MKILLMYCDDSSAARFGKSRKEFPPLGLLYLGAACEANGVEVELANICVGDLVALPHQRIVGLSINSSYNYSIIHENIEAIRGLCDILVVGGQHATVFPRETLSELKADYLIVGEGENSLPRLIHACYAGMVPECDNILARDGDGRVYTEAMRIDDLDGLPFPARHLMNDSDILLDRRIHGKDVQSVSLITSRGCPHRCEFCANVYKGFHYRNAANVGAEIIQLFRDYPEMGGLVFLDENLMFSQDYVRALCERIAEYKLDWTCNARVDCFSKSLVRQMRECGCVEIKYGMESGSQRMLNKMKKGITTSQISKALIGSYEVGIRTKCFLMFGFPGDNLESAKETIEFISSHEQFISRINLFSFSPLPNSPVFSTIGHSTKDASWKDYRLYDQHVHWWGTQSEYREMINAYRVLDEFINERYGEAISD